MLTIRLDSEVPLVDQIVRGVRAAIAEGVVLPGDELPPVRQLANDLGINLNTVARAYRALEGRGLVRTARGRGTLVTAATESPPSGDSADRVNEAVRDAFVDAKLAGIERPAAERIFREQVARLWPEVSP
jgi:GntR family transcriptional regulator